MTFDATARLTNIQFTTDLLDAGSQAYKYLTESIVAEVSERLVGKRTARCPELAGVQPTVMPPSPDLQVSVSRD